MRYIFIISSRTLCIGRNTFHRQVNLLWFVFICADFRCVIYFLWSIHTSFSILRIPENFLICSVRFREICNEMILLSTSEAHIWFPTITFITIIIIVSRIGGWFIIAFFLFLFLKKFLSWAQTYTMTAPWLSKIWYLIISY